MFDVLMIALLIAGVLGFWRFALLCQSLLLP